MTDTIDNKAIAGIIEYAVERALDGSMNDNLRVTLYRLAILVCSEEFYRIEAQHRGTVNPASLLLLQQLTVLADENPNPERIIGMAHVQADQDSGGSLADASEVRTDELGSAEGNT